jgi:hypothetical protein
LSPVNLSSCATSAIGLKIKNIKKLKCWFLMVDVSTAPSPINFLRERILSHINVNGSLCPLISMRGTSREWNF